MFQLLFPLFLLISQISQIDSVPYDESELNKCIFSPNITQFEKFGPTCKAESLNFSLAFDINIGEAQLVEDNCASVFICYASSFADNVRNENPKLNKVTAACSGIHGIHLEICKGATESEIKRSMELSFRKRIHPENGENPKIHINGNNISVEFKSLLTLWNVERLKLLKHIQFYNGRNALQKIANHWLIPIDIFGGWKKFKDKSKIFTLSPDGITVREANELLNSLDCTFKTTTTPKMSTSSLASTQTTESVISTPTTQSGAESTEITNNSLSTESSPQTTPIPTTTEIEPTLTPCDEECQNEIKNIMMEITTLEKNCKLQELPSEVKGREIVNSSIKTPLFPCSELNRNGDIKQTLGMAQELLKTTKKRCNNTSADVEIHKIPIKTWALPIRYIFDATIGDDLRKPIGEAIRMIEKETCIKFEEINGNADDLPYLEFTKYVCLSDLGQVVPKGAQKISFHAYTHEPGEILHMILHALGVQHEHQREDRDDKIWINWANIFNSDRSKFDKLATEQFNTPYDFGSIMHFGPTAYNANGKKYTIITKDHQFQHTIGQRKGMSFKDAKLLNKLYKCQESCTRKCSNGGYPDPNNCGTCKCPAPFEGASCDDNDCVDMNMKFAQNGSESTYNSDKHKCVRFKTNTLLHFVPLVKIKEIHGLPDEHNCPMTCQLAYVEIKSAGDDPTATGARICCTNLLPFTVPWKESVYTYLLLQGEIEVRFAYEFKSG